MTNLSNINIDYQDFLFSCGSKFCKTMSFNPVWDLYCHRDTFTLIFCSEDHYWRFSLAAKWVIQGVPLHCLSKILNGFSHYLGRFR